VSRKVINHKDSAPRTGENPTQQNKLLEEKDSERLAPEAAYTPTMGKIDRA